MPSGKRPLASPADARRIIGLQKPAGAVTRETSTPLQFKTRRCASGSINLRGTVQPGGLGVEPVVRPANRQCDRARAGGVPRNQSRPAGRPRGARAGRSRVGATRFRASVNSGGAQANPSGIGVRRCGARVNWRGGGVNPDGVTVNPGWAAVRGSGKPVNSSGDDVKMGGADVRPCGDGVKPIKKRRICVLLPRKGAKAQDPPEVAFFVTTKLWTKSGGRRRKAAVGRFGLQRAMLLRLLPLGSWGASVGHCKTTYAKHEKTNCLLSFDLWPFVGDDRMRDD